MEAVAARGTWMGNCGGRIHDPASGALTGRAFASRRWICCKLCFRNRRRTVFAHGYTEMFFLDEVTALTAGHRPCFECRRVDAMRFACAAGLTGARRADEIDGRLHRERRIPLSARPPMGRADAQEGAMLAVGADAVLHWRGRWWRWSQQGYAPFDIGVGPHPLLTPPTVIAAFHSGYVPQVHPTAN